MEADDEAERVQRAATEAEAIQGRTHPRTRPLFGTGSQVVLACITKGRSASPSLNSILRRSLGNLLVTRVCVQIEATRSVSVMHSGGGIGITMDPDLATNKVPGAPSAGHRS